MRLFSGGKISRDLLCSHCKGINRNTVLHYSENIFILNVFEDIYKKQSHLSNLLQSDIEKKRCLVCGKITMFNCSVKMNKFPQILIISLEEDFSNPDIHQICPVHKTLEFSQSIRKFLTN